MKANFFRRLFGTKPPPAAASQITFDQANATVREQTNIGKTEQVNIYMSGGKLPPQVGKLTYRLDRVPQCLALMNYLTAAPIWSRPVCVIVTGLEDDLPHRAATTLLDFIAREVFLERNIADFHQPRSPLCLEWEDYFVSCDRLWREIGEKFFDLPRLHEPSVARSELKRRPGSIAFGFQLDVDLWSKHKGTLAAWIEDLQACDPPPSGLALAVILLSGGRSRESLLQQVWSELKEAYSNNPYVLVLPKLEAVEFKDVRSWRSALLQTGGVSFEEGKLDTLALTLFPDDTQPRRMGEIWDTLLERVCDAWVGP